MPRKDHRRQMLRHLVVARRVVRAVARRVRRKPRPRVYLVPHVDSVRFLLGAKKEGSRHAGRLGYTEGILRSGSIGTQGTAEARLLQGSVLRDRLGFLQRVGCQDPRLTTLGKIAYLRAIEFPPAEQHRGHFPRFLQTVEDWARKQGASLLYTASSRPRMDALMRKAGYARYQVRNPEGALAGGYVYLKFL